MAFFLLHQGTLLLSIPYLPIRAVHGYRVGLKNMIFGIDFAQGIAYNTSFVVKIF